MNEVADYPWARPPVPVEYGEPPSPGSPGPTVEQAPVGGWEPQEGEISEAVTPGAGSPPSADPTVVRGGGFVASPEPFMFEPEAPPAQEPPAWEPAPAPPVGEQTMHRERLVGFPPSPPLTPPADQKRSRGPLVALVLLLLVAAVVAGAVFLSGGDDDERAGGTTTTTRAENRDTTTTEPEAEEAPPTTAPTTTAPADPVDLEVTDVTAPATAPDGFDACQAATTFAAGNLVDGAADTAWRMPGDGSGQSVTITLSGEHQVLAVGLIPGYAKVDPCDGTDRFTQNRRPTRVTWRFDDGTEVTQPLQDAAEMQTIEVDATTRTIELSIDGVTPDPDRDFTAISELTIQGT